MHSSLIGKIEKAKLYAREPERVSFKQFTVAFHGEHNDYEVGYEHGNWHCQCSFFSHWNTCSHTMALERILGPMLPQAEKSTVTVENS